MIRPSRIVRDVPVRRLLFEFLHFNPGIGHLDAEHDVLEIDVHFLENAVKDSLAYWATLGAKRR